MFLRQFTQEWFWFPDPLPLLPLELQGYVTMSDSLADLTLLFKKNLRRGHLHSGFASAVKILDSQSARKAKQTGRWWGILCLSVFFSLLFLSCLCLLVSVLGIQFRALGMAGQLCTYELLHILSSLSYFWDRILLCCPGQFYPQFSCLIFQVLSS